MITERQLGLAAPNALKSGRLTVWYPWLVKAMLRCAITTPARLCYFLANVLEETGELQAREENLHYSPERAMQVWPSVFTSPEVAQAICAGGPRAIANAAYGGRMGNVDPDDGWKYRGRGDMELTGRSNYEHYFARVGLPIDSDPDLLLLPEHGSLSAAIYWVDAGCNEIADRGDFVAEVVRVNGGTINLATRELYEGRLEDALKHPDPVVMAQVVPPVAPKPAEIPAPPVPDAPVPVTAEEWKLPPQLEPVAPLPPVPPAPMEPPPNFETKPNGNVVLTDINKSTIVKKTGWTQMLGWFAATMAMISTALQQFKDTVGALLGSVHITDTVAICIAAVAIVAIIAGALVARSAGKDRIRLWLQGIA